MNAVIYFRDGEKVMTSIDESNTPISIGQRMSGGYMVGKDNKWNKQRTIIVNMKDVKCVIMESPENNPIDILRRTT